MPGQPGVRAASALVAAAPVAAVSLAALEWTRAPSMGASGAAVLLDSAWPTFVFPTLALFGLALAQPLTRPRCLAVSPFACLAVGCAVAFVLADGPGFRWHPLTWAVGAATAGLTALAATRLARGPWWLAAGLVGLGLGLARAHYRVWSGHYPNVHAAALSLAFVCLALGVAVAPRVRGSRAGLGALSFMLLLVGLASNAGPDARRVAMSTTELARGAGVARVLRRQRASLLPTELPTRTELPTWTARRRDGTALFDTHSGLPELPADFDLSRHDVLLVLIDAARHDRAVREMPALGAFAARSQSFVRAMSPSNGTFPSVASMMAMAPVSRAELDIRPRFWRGSLRAERQTAAEAMRLAGRRTFWVGHDHRGCFRDNIHGLEQGFEHVERVFQAHGPEDADVDQEIASRAIEAMRARPDERFFGLVFFVSPHDDYQSHGHAARTEAARYDAELRFADRQLARILEAAPDDAVIVVAGDHGEALGEHGHHHHLSSLHREQIHVPLVVHVPGAAPAEHTAPTSTAYVLPWLLARGAPAERAAATRVFEQDFGPWMHALSGAVTSEMIGPQAQGVALALPDHDIVYDVFADLARIYDAHRDPAQSHDLSESRPALRARYAPLIDRYRRTRFSGQRFRFVVGWNHGEP